MHLINLALSKTTHSKCTSKRKVVSMTAVYTYPQTYTVTTRRTKINKTTKIVLKTLSKFTSAVYMSSCVATSEYESVLVNTHHAFWFRTSKHSIPSTHKTQILNYYGISSTEITLD
jgi:hypothetical protein